MKLHWSPRSPFVRKVMIMAYEVGIADRIDRVRSVAAATKPHAALMRDNPLSKIPTLVLDDGSPLYDSRVICEYFDTLHRGPKLHCAGRRSVTACWIFWSYGGARRNGRTSPMFTSRVMLRGARHRSPHLNVKRVRLRRRASILATSPSVVHCPISISGLPTSHGEVITRA
jgi:glutathione S-transferase